MFLERVNSNGMAGNKYWYSREWNHGAGTNNAMPNCTTFCVGEAYEETNVSKAFQMFNGDYTNPGAFPEAKYWYNSWVQKKGVEPQTGGIAVWGASKSFPKGHVAIVLDTKDVGSAGAWMRVAQSNYKGIYFEVKEYTVKKGQITPGVGCPYIGCCYLDINDMRVERNKNRLQVEVLADLLQARVTPNGRVYTGRRVPNGIYNVFDRMKAGDYTWAQLDKDTWVALNDKDGWTRTYEVEKMDYATLKNAYDILSQKYTELALKYKKETGKEP